MYKFNTQKNFVYIYQLLQKLLSQTIWIGSAVSVFWQFQKIWVIHWADLFVIPRSPAALFGEKVENYLLVLVEALGVHKPALVAVGAVAGHLHHVAPVQDLGAEAGHLLW